MEKQDNYSNTVILGITQSTEIHGEYCLEIKSAAFTKE